MSRNWSTNDQQPDSCFLFFFFCIPPPLYFPADMHLDLASLDISPFLPVVVLRFLMLTSKSVFFPSMSRSTIPPFFPLMMILGVDTRHGTLGPTHFSPSGRPPPVVVEGGSRGDGHRARKTFAQDERPPLLQKSRLEFPNLSHFLSLVLSFPSNGEVSIRCRRRLLF